MTRAAIRLAPAVFLVPLIAGCGSVKLFHRAHAEPRPEYQRVYVNADPERVWQVLNALLSGLSSVEEDRRERRHTLKGSVRPFDGAEGKLTGIWTQAWSDQFFYGRPDTAQALRAQYRLVVTVSASGPHDTLVSIHEEEQTDFQQAELTPAVRREIFKDEPTLAGIGDARLPLWEHWVPTTPTGSRASAVLDAVPSLLEEFPAEMKGVQLLDALDRFENAQKSARVNGHGLFVDLDRPPFRKPGSP